MSRERRANRIAGENRRLLVRLGISAVVMFGFGFLLVPFYEQICEATGINNLLQPDKVSVENTQVDRSRTVLVQFDANLHDLPWRFQPQQRSVTVHPGEMVHVAYEVGNKRDRPITGQAVPAPGEQRTMPLVFVLDPKLPADVTTITLSYTFFEIQGRNAAKASLADKS
ncbi:MAG: cytochrome c oxidase assembly protein [Betaproteobacteria bacterium HGW-Betaproteobacteria-13]|nr:MAG: cytochrome c oxidase assembly protein [Betaproteobacteria bacterium HGW-Betaproteobacteria-13]